MLAVIGSLKYCEKEYWLILEASLYLWKFPKILHLLSALLVDCTKGEVLSQVLCLS